MPRGGIRIGAGRPKGQGKFGEKPKPIRIPLSMVDNLVSFLKNNDLYLRFYILAYLKTSYHIFL